jgi:predicted nucleic acid-binding protein
VIVVDTSVLIYAVGGEHPLREPTLRVVDAVGDGLAATTTAEVIQEFVHVRSRTHGRDNAIAHGRRWSILLSPLLPVTERELTAGLELYGQTRLGAFDAILAAAAVASPARALVSGDRAFAEVRGLSFVDLASPELDRLLGT